MEVPLLHESVESLRGDHFTDMYREYNDVSLFSSLSLHRKTRDGRREDGDLFGSRFSKGKRARRAGAKLQQIVARPEIEIMTQPVPSHKTQETRSVSAPTHLHKLRDGILSLFSALSPLSLSLTHPLALASPTRGTGSIEHSERRLNSNVSGETICPKYQWKTSHDPCLVSPVTKLSCSGVCMT